MERKKETLFYNNKKKYNTIMIVSDILSFLSLIFLIIFIIMKIIHFQDAGKTLITLFFSSLPFFIFFCISFDLHLTAQECKAIQQNRKKRMELLQTQANNLQELKLNINELLTTYNKLKNNKEILDILCGYLVQNPSLINFRYIEFLVPIPNIYLHLNDLNNVTYINELKSSHKDILPLQCLLELLKYNKLLCIVKNIETYIKRNDTNHKMLINAYYHYNTIYNIYEHYNHFNKLLLDSLISNHLIKNTFEEKFAILSLLLQLFKTSEFSNFKDEIVENYDLEENQNIEYYIYNLLTKNHTLNCELFCINYNSYENVNTSTYNLRDSAISKYSPLIDTFKEKFNKKQYLNRLKNLTIPNKTTINNVDLMSGREFEIFVSELFTKMGYQTTVTPESNDQGIDVIATKNNSTLAIQAKCYNSVVGNHAIMEAVAGKNYYNADICMVITNNHFTKSAKQLAQKNNVTLWDRAILEEKINQFQE